MDIKCVRLNGSNGFQVIVKHMPAQVWKCLLKTCSSLRKMVPGCENCCPQTIATEVSTTVDTISTTLSTTVESVSSTRKTGFNSPQNDEAIRNMLIGFGIAFSIVLVVFILYKLMKFKRRQSCQGFLPVYFVKDTTPDVVTVHPEDDDQLTDPVQETTSRPETTSKPKNEYPLLENNIAGLP